jgi:ferritin-like metal-binding protein YciE
LASFFREVSSNAVGTAAFILAGIMALSGAVERTQGAFVKHERAAINGITEEGSEILKGFKGMPALDADLLAAAQAVE